MGLYGQIPEENRGFVDTTVFRTIPKFNPADELRWDEQRSARVHAQGRSAQRPVRVNNAERIYFPPIFHQENASCTAASRIAYMFTYEQNAARRLDGSVEENQYPTHYNWLHYYQNTDYPSVLRDHGVPNAVTYGGRTYSKDFGADQNWYSNDYGWMQGYDKWYSAMFNRIDRSAMFPQNVRTEAGREAVKQWLWNHSGDDSFDAGGVCAIDIGFVEGFHTGTVPQTTVNKEIGAAGEGYVVRWGVAVDHSMVVVGYDDRVEFDLDGNGIAGEKDKDEVGAWIVANTWGETWDGNGLIYCPYKTAVCIGTDGAGMPDQYYRGYWMPDVYFVRRDYRPLRTMKMALDFSHRSEITLVAGVASDTAATEPERTVAMEYFKFAGNGMKLDDNIYPDAATPMLGRWADGTLHTEPMELGYDLTALTEGFDLRKPLKYFFIIESKQSAQGVGRVHNLSVIDYEFDAHGIETMAQLPEEGVSIQNKGGRTVLSVVMSGESFPMPRNLTGASGKLQWEAPAASAYSVSGFRIYQGKTSVADVAAGQMEYALEAGASGRYSVVALYDFCGKFVESGAAEIYVSDRPEMSAQNLVRELWGASAFTLPNHKAYQTITLPAGFYQFSVSFGPYSKTLESYLVVSAGAGLPDVANVSEALAYTDLANGKLTFQLAEETEVSLGVLINWTDENNWGCITIDRFSLGEIPYDEIDGNGETGIECVQPAVAEEVSVRAVRGGLYVSSDEPQLVQIYTVSGAKVFQESVVGTRPIMLSPGVYIVNRQKVMVP